MSINENIKEQVRAFSTFSTRGSLLTEIPDQRSVHDHLPEERNEELSPSKERTIPDEYSSALDKFKEIWNAKIKLINDISSENDEETGLLNNNKKNTDINVYEQGYLKMAMIDLVSFWEVFLTQLFPNSDLCGKKINQHYIFDYIEKKYEKCRENFTTQVPSGIEKDVIFCHEGYNSKSCGTLLLLLLSLRHRYAHGVWETTIKKGTFSIFRKNYCELEKEIEENYYKNIFKYFENENDFESSNEYQSFKNYWELKKKLDLVKMLDNSDTNKYIQREVFLKDCEELEKGENKYNELKQNLDKKLNEKLNKTDNDNDQKKKKN